jgi:hypothetical protein
MRAVFEVPALARPVLWQAAEVWVPARNLPLLAGVVGVAAPMVALSGLVPAAASPLLLAIGVIAALALSRGGPESGR